MDEPTSSLSEKEVRSLFRQIGILKSKGMTILYITHKLEEIFEIGDNVTVLRDGKVVGTRAVADIDKGQLIEMMIGRKLEVFFPTIELRQGRPVLQLEGLRSGKGRFMDVSFTLHQGEILGLYGLVGAGRTELAEAIFGVDREYEGTLRLNGQVIMPGSPQGAMDLGIAYLPENRQIEGLVLKMDIANNITLAILKEITRRGFVRKKLELQRAVSSIESMRIVCTGPAQTVENLSGGNQQKVLVGKWLNLRPKVLILDEPTHGIDVATKAEVYHLMKTLVERGTPILLISSELPEVMGLSSRILVMGAGAIRGEFRRNEWTREKIIEAAIAG
jgi:ABC-type sugar transport system ATPase subunit